MARKPKLVKDEVPPFYKFTECRVEGHTWKRQKDYPMRTDEGGLLYKSKCPGCGSIRYRYFNHRGIRVPERCRLIYPKGYTIEGGMPRAQFIIHVAHDAGLG